MIINSLKSHYILSSVLLFTAIIFVLFYTSLSVNKSTKQSLTSVENRKTVQELSSNIRDSIWETDSFINAYIINSSKDNKRNLLLGLTHLKINIDKLLTNSWSSTENRRQLLLELNLIYLLSMMKKKMFINT